MIRIGSYYQRPTPTQRRAMIQREEAIRRDEKKILELKMGTPFIGFGKELSERLKMWADTRHRIHLLNKRIEFLRTLN